MLWSAGKTRLDYRLENPHKRGTTQLGQGVQAGARPEEGEGDRFLLWPSATGQDVALQM